MGNFIISKSMDKTIDSKDIKDRNKSMLEFNTRVLSMAENKEVPIMERMNYLKIVFSNLDEFISVRLADSKKELRKEFIQELEDMYQKMGKLYYEISSNLNHDFSESINEINPELDKELREDVLYYVFLDKDGKYNMYPLKSDIISLKKLLSLIYLLDPNYKNGFLVRLLSNKTFEYVFTGEDTNSHKNEINEATELKIDKIFLYLQTTCQSDYVIEEFIDYMHLGIDGVIKLPEDILNINNNINLLKRYNKNPRYYYDEFNPAYDDKINYYEYLSDSDFIIRTPYISYNHITDFIDQMCNHENITHLYITLYRTAKESIIIKSLIKAAELGKQVYIYIEPMARGNEEMNVALIKRLKKIKNIHVSSNYLEYKIHSKLFCAVDKYGNSYVHIGTGNYNEITSKIYTDFHFLSCKKEYGNIILKIFLYIFGKIKIRINSPYIFMAPYNLRDKLMELIEDEIRKGKDGRIYIKCNTLYDAQVIDKLIEASYHNVDIKLIVRNKVELNGYDKISIKSRVGRFLEHERIYIFGNKIFISSADILLRNIEKRVECLCEIKGYTKYYIFSTFNSLWDIL